MSDEISLSFTAAEWNVIRVGLYELPLKISGQLVWKLEQKLAEAQKPRPIKGKEAASG